MSAIIRGFVLIAVVLAVAGLIAYRVRPDSDVAVSRCRHDGTPQHRLDLIRGRSPQPTQILPAHSGARSRATLPRRRGLPAEPFGRRSRVPLRATGGPPPTDLIPSRGPRAHPPCPPASGSTASAAAVAVSASSHRFLAAPANVPGIPIAIHAGIIVRFASVACRALRGADVQRNVARPSAAVGADSAASVALPSSAAFA